MKKQIHLNTKEWWTVGDKQFSNGDFLAYIEGCQYFLLDPSQKQLSGNLSKNFYEIKIWGNLFRFGAQQWASNKIQEGCFGANFARDHATATVS